MLTPNEEKFCRNIEIEKMSQTDAFLDAYPKSKKWLRKTVHEKASVLANEDKIVARRNELRAGMIEDAMQDAKWTRQDAYNNLTWLIERAKEEIQKKGKMSSACVSAILNAVKELDELYAVMETKDGSGVLKEILSAVGGIDND